MTYTSTGGHGGHCVAVKAIADSPIERYNHECEYLFNDKQKESDAMAAVAKKFASWLPVDLVAKSALLKGFNIDKEA